jgi:hypothetical protein
MNTDQRTLKEVNLVLTTLTSELQSAIALPVCASESAVIEHMATSLARYVGTTNLILRTCTGQTDRALAITRAGITHIGKQAVPFDRNVEANDPAHICTIVDYSLRSHTVLFMDISSRTTSGPSSGLSSNSSISSSC